MILLGVEWRGMAFKVVVHEAEEGGFWAEVPLLPGCISEGETLDELEASIREAINGWIAAATDSAPVPGTRLMDVAV